MGLYKGFRSKITLELVNPCEQILFTRKTVDSVKYLEKETSGIFGRVHSYFGHNFCLTNI